MFDFKSLIGLELNSAKEKLEKFGIKNICIQMNADHNEKCDTILVCAVKSNETEVTLICGEFLMNLKG